MTPQNIDNTLLAAAFGTLAVTSIAQTITPSQNDASAAQTNAEQDRLPASKGESSGTQGSSGTTTNAGKSNAAPVAKHPPTSNMDRATPTLSAPNKRVGGKLPATDAMDSATPQEKSPGTDEPQSGSRTPRTK